MRTTNETRAFNVARKLGINSHDLVRVGNFWICIEEITPDRAEEWLKYNKDNRAYKERHINKMSADIKAGNWELTHQGIAFGFDCILKDGQNRLSAVIQSGEPIQAMIFIGLTEKGKRVVDQNVNRSAMDAAKFAGKDVKKLQISASKLCEAGPLGNTYSFSNSMQLELIDKYAEAYNFVRENLIGEKGQKGITVAAIIAAIMRAFLSVKTNKIKLNRLKLFCRILQDGQYDRVESNVAAFRLREKALKGNWGGSSYAKELYRLTESAIDSFFQKAEIKKLVPAQKELFPLDFEIIEEIEVQEKND